LSKNRWSLKNINIAKSSSVFFSIALSSAFPPFPLFRAVVEHFRLWEIVGAEREIQF